VFFGHGSRGAAQDPGCGCAIDSRDACATFHLITSRIRAMGRELFTFPHFAISGVSLFQGPWRANRRAQRRRAPSHCVRAIERPGPRRYLTPQPHTPGELCAQSPKTDRSGPRARFSASRRLVRGLALASAGKLGRHWRLSCAGYNFLAHSCRASLTGRALRPATLFSPTATPRVLPPPLAGRVRTQSSSGPHLWNTVSRAIHWLSTPPGGACGARYIGFSRVWLKNRRVGRYIDSIPRVGEL